MIVMEASDRASVPIDELIEKIKDLASSMNDAATKIAVAGDRIDASLAKTAAEAEVSSDALKDSLDKNTDSTNSLTSALEKTVSVMDPFGTKLKLIAMGVSAVSGPLAGLLALAPVALFGGMAIGAYELSKSLTTAAASGTALTATQRKLLPVAKELTTAFAPVYKAAQGAFTSLLSVVKQLGPSLKLVGTVLAPMVTVLGGALGQVLTNVIRPLAVSLSTLMPLVKALAGGLVTLSSGLVSMLQNIDILPAVQGLTMLFNTVGMLLPILGDLLNALMPIGNVILSVLVPAIGGALDKVLNALTPVFTAMTPVVAQFAGVFAELIGTFGDLLTAVAPLIPAIINMFTAFDNLDTTFEAIDPLFADLSKVIKPLIGIVVQIASVIVNLLNTALTLLATSLVPLVPMLGTLANTVLTALLDVVNALAPAIKPLLNVIISLLPFVGKLAMILSQLIKIAVVPLVGALGRLLQSLLPLLPPLEQLAAQAFTAVLQIMVALEPVFQQLIKAVIQMVPSIQQLVPQVVQLLQALLPLIPALTPLIILMIELATKIASVVIPMLVLLDQFLFKIVSVLLTALIPAVHLLVDGVTTEMGHLEQVFGGVTTFISGVFHGNWSKAWIGIANVFLGFVEALATPIQIIYEKFSEIPKKIENYFNGSGNWLYQAGVALIEGLWNGIENRMTGLLGDVGSAASTIVHTFEHALGINSPSKRMEVEVGAYVSEGLAQGILKNLGVIQQAAQRAGALTVSSAKTGISAAGGTGALTATTAGGTAGGSVYVDLRGSQVMTDRDMDLLIGKLGRALATRVLPTGGLRMPLR